jgi:hypothetical protein
MAERNPTFEGGSISLTLHAYDPEVERRPVEELYGAFRRARKDADRHAGELAARWGALDLGFEELPRPPGISEEEWQRAQLGSVVEAEGRLLLDGLGGEADMLYAAPTENDCIAHALLPNGGGGCAAPGPDGLGMGWHRSEAGEFTVFGIVGDAVDAVDVVVAGTAHEARMGENAFALRLERTHEADLERVVLHRRDGTTNPIELTLE